MVGGVVLLTRQRRPVADQALADDNTPQSNVNTSETAMGVSDADDGATGDDVAIQTTQAPNPDKPDQTSTLVDDGLGLVQPSGTSGGPSTGGDPSGTTGTGAAAPFSGAGLGIGSSQPQATSLMVAVHGTGASYSRASINTTYRDMGPISGVLW